MIFFFIHWYIFFSYRWVCALHHYQYFFSHTITINCALGHVALKHFTLVILALFFRKKDYINFVPKFVNCPSIRTDVHLCVRPSIRFLVNTSIPKPLDGATSNFVPRQVICCRGYWAIFRVTLTPRSRQKVRK